MLKKIKDITTTIAAAILLAVPVLAPVTVHANTIQDNLCNGLDVADGKDNQAGTPNTTCTADTADNNSGLNKIIRFVINIFSLVVGAISVIMIIYAGFKYITSGGNDSNVTSAKNTIVYALIGLVIVALAQIIVRFVLSKAANVA